MLVLNIRAALRGFLVKKPHVLKRHSEKSKIVVIFNTIQTDNLFHMIITFEWEHFF